MNIIIFNILYILLQGYYYIFMELRLKELLALRGMTLKEFASVSGISQSNLSNYINGNISPTLETLNRIATNLGVDIVELFREKDDVELFAKHNGTLYPITKEDILEVISKNERKL